MTQAPVLLWLRRDLRLADNPALTAAVAPGGPLIPVFILDPETEALGAASKWRLGRSLADLDARLRNLGSALVLRRGPALDVLHGLATDTGATAVHWSRLYTPDAVARDTAVKAGLKAYGVAADSHPGHLLREPWTLQTKAGGPFRVFTPFWRASGPLGAPEPLPAPARLPAPETWPASDTLADWRLDAAMNRGGAVLAQFAAAAGEDAARDRLDAFVAEHLGAYAQDRDRPDLAGTSRISAALTWGEISPATVWRAGARAMNAGAAGAETFLKELIWREFAAHLLWHSPTLETENWRADWDGFPWEGDGPAAERWRRGLTGEPMVDAGMREMFVTGTMHNRMRMLVASYLCKHLMIHWKVGLDWFADCLVDWDPASNALGWQWVAGSGPDAAPYFRVFNPETQAEKFDPQGEYRRRFVAGATGSDAPEARAYFDATPRSWRMHSSDPYPKRMVELHAGRDRALTAYSKHKAGLQPPAD